MDTIIMVKDGKISQMGSYTELLLQNGAFADFLQTYTCAEQNGNSDPEGTARDAEVGNSSTDELEDSHEQTAWNSTDSPLKSDIAHQDEKKEQVLGKLTEADRAHIGRVKLSVYMEYLRTMGGFCLFLITLFYTIQQTAAFTYNYWIGLWADDPVINGTQQHTQLRIGVYSFFGLIQEILLIIAIATPLAAVAFLPLGLLYFFLQRFFVATSRQLKRLESVSKSPLYTHFNETLQGVHLIRVFKEQGRFIQDNYTRLDTNQKLYYSSFVANRWLSVRCDLLSNFIVFSVAVVGVICRGSISPGFVGLAVVNSLRLTGLLNAAVHTATELETNSVALERVKEYYEVESEAAWSSNQSTTLQHWPQKGEIAFTGYGLRYRNDLELALRDITVSISEGEKIGIVGRTGAGKSSLTLGLFRILEPATGQICIDGIDISKLGLHELRSKLTIIPQDPVLFSGSLRMNLDPFDSYADEAIWTALEFAHLKNFVTSLPDKLNHACSEGGENLSVGQRQLVCLARALLRKTKILVLDEATAAVDVETDGLIQSTIQAQFTDCTILTIAHRLNTIMDSTRIIVFDKGQIVEFDSPSNLLAHKGLFYSMANDANII